MARRWAQTATRDGASVMAAQLRAAHEVGPDLLRGPLLLVDDETGIVGDEAHALGIEVLRWDRRASAPGQATAWPPDAQAGACAIRLPKGRDAARMVLEASLSRVAVEGPCFLYGHNDEGIRSAGADLEMFCDEVHTASTKRHCRVWRGRRSADPLRGEIDAFAEQVTLDLPGGLVRIVSFAGLFAHGHLDPATALLASALPRLRPDAAVLDFGCGSGALLLAAAQLAPGAVLHGLDADALALEAARRNLPGARLHHAERLADLPADLRFDLVLSNPPIHEGRARDTSVVEALARDAATRLTRRGQLLAVAQRTLPLSRWLEERFGEVGLAAESRSFRVWRAAHPVGTRARSGRRSSVG